MTAHDWQAGGFGLYIHWPFCESKCPYCDFNSHVAERVDQYAWLEAYRSEIRRQAAETHGRVLQTVYFGGGTPSLMAQDVVAGIIECVRENWRTVNDLEITLEANHRSYDEIFLRPRVLAGVGNVDQRDPPGVAVEGFS
jgi:oxygen-independent coproporphyrinogen-3 oxidase